MAWPQAPQPAPPPPTAGPSLPLGPIITAGAAFLTLVFSFVQIAKADSGFSDAGVSVWTTDFGLFGVGTLIPLLALLAGAAALARGFVPSLADKQVAGFGLLQVQLASVVFAVIVWLGYVVNILLADFVTFGLGTFLLFVGLAGVAAGTVLSALDLKKGTTTGISTSPGGPASGQWPAPTPPPAPQPQPQQWQPQPAPQPQPQQWQQPPPPAWDPNAPAAPGQWQPDPAGAPAPPQQSWTPPPAPGQGWPPPGASDPGGPAPYPAPAPPGPVPEPGPLDPRPAPPLDPQPEPGPAPAGGGLYDPGTQVIPGPPPAPPADDPGHVGAGPDALPPIPPSNTP